MNRFRQFGFTTIELIMVIVLIGIIAAVAVPRFLNTDDFNEHQFHSDALNAARYARQFAVTKGCATRFSLTAVGFSLFRDANCDSSDGNTFTSPIAAPDDPNQDYTNTDAPPGTDTGAIIFDSMGSADSSQTLATGNTTNITVDAATGFVR